MCIIVAKEIGIEMPSMETLERCFQANPDGAGFMWADGKMVHIRKGFMEYEDFVDALDSEIPEAERRDTAIVMHFRIATHGKVQPGCCHPFPLTDDKKQMAATSTKSRFGVAHNGIIHGRMTNDNWSDSMDFIAYVMTPLMKMNPSFMFNDHALDLLEGACDSKLAIMENSGEIATVGKFYEDDGVLYSNTSYVRSLWNYTSYESLWTTPRLSYGYDYDDDDDYGSSYVSNYGGNAYDKYYEAAYGDKLDDLIAHLPFECCQDCYCNEECALTQPCCVNEDDAYEMYNAVEEEMNRAMTAPIAGDVD